MSACPSAATLARLGLDPMPDETLSTIEDHIAGCAECQAELNRLVRNDAAGAAAPDLPSRGERPEIPGFVIERELGRGTMSVVYLARQPSLGRLVALKVVRSGPAAGSREYARWLREGRSFSLLRHENVVRLHDVGEAGGWLYLVLEYVPGGTLNDRLDAPSPAPEAARLLAAIAEAVAAIHRVGLLHLDLKPSNILMDAPPGTPRHRATPRVGDFGLAYLWDDPEATSGTIGPTGPIGTPRYMAPEQVGADRGRLGPPADVYGLGALLYHVITGRPPFVAPSVAETLDQVRGQEPVPPRRLNPAIPRDLETICLKCLRKEPAHRYASAQDVADDLRRFLDGRAIAARPASPAERTWRWCRRRPAVAGLAAALATAVCAGFLGMFLLWRHAESQRGRAEWERARSTEARARAEVDSRRAIQLLGRLIEMNVGGRENVPKVVTPSQTIDLLRLARRTLLELVDRLPDREAMYTQWMAIDLRLGRILAQEGRWGELRAHCEASLRDAEAAARQLPRTHSLGAWSVENLDRLAQLAAREKRLDDAEALYARAVARSERWHAADPGTPTLVSLLTLRRCLAMVLADRGRPDEARAQLLANRRSLEDAPAGLELGEAMVAARALNSMAFRYLRLEPPAPPRRGPGANASAAAIATLGSPEADRLSPDAWAQVAARALLFGDPARPAAYRESLAAREFSRWIKMIASEQRTRGVLDEARTIVERFVALGRLLVGLSPDDPDAHLILADAHEQLAKNAWRVEDHPTIRRNLRQAIEANLRALDLTPYDDLARHELEIRQRKYTQLPDRR